MLPVSLEVFLQELHPILEEDILLQLSIALEQQHFLLEGGGRVEVPTDALLAGGRVRQQEGEQVAVGQVVVLAVGEVQVQLLL